MTDYFDLLHEEQSFLIVQKHPGISFHRKLDEVGLFQQIQLQLPHEKEVIPSIESR